MPRGSGSVDKAPDSHWTKYASSKLERHKYSFITMASRLYEPERENKYVVSGNEDIAFIQKGNVFVQRGVV